MVSSGLQVCILMVNHPLHYIYSGKKYILMQPIISEYLYWETIVDTKAYNMSSMF